MKFLLIDPVDNLDPKSNDDNQVAQPYTIGCPAQWNICSSLGVGGGGPPSSHTKH